MEFLLIDANFAFMASLAIFVAIFALELIGLLAGHSFLGGETDFDTDADFDTDGGIADWLGLGRLPLLAFVAIFSVVFGIVGLILNQITFNIIGTALTPFLSVPVAFIIAVPIVAKTATTISRWLPRDESNGIRLEELVGSEATITVGTATHLISAPAMAYDSHGVQHNFSVRSYDENVTLTERQKVILDHMSDEGFFYARLKP